MPFGLPPIERFQLFRSTLGGALRVYPDRSYAALTSAVAGLHGLRPASILVGNGAAELFTWAARDAAAAGISWLPEPGFADYRRALSTWGAELQPFPLIPDWSGAFPQEFPGSVGAGALWLTNPHNPTGQLWSRESLAPYLARQALVICDEAFLPLVPGGENQSLIPLLEDHPNLVVIRSLTKLYGVAGIRLGYALGAPERLARWSGWRDPWPVNGLAAALGERLLRDPQRHRRWSTRVQHWVAEEGAWLASQLASLPGISPMPSAANFLLIRSKHSLLPMRQALEERHRILLRDCRSFAGLGENWLRIGYQSRPQNRRIVEALSQELASSTKTAANC